MAIAARIEERQTATDVGTLNAEKAAVGNDAIQAIYVCSNLEGLSPNVTDTRLPKIKGRCQL